MSTGETRWGRVRAVVHWGDAVPRVTCGSRTDSNPSPSFECPRFSPSLEESDAPVAPARIRRRAKRSISSAKESKEASTSFASTVQSCMEPELQKLRDQVAQQATLLEQLQRELLSLHELQSVPPSHKSDMNSYTTCAYSRLRVRRKHKPNRDHSHLDSAGTPATVPTANAMPAPDKGSIAEGTVGEGSQAVDSNAMAANTVYYTLGETIWEAPLLLGAIELGWWSALWLWLILVMNIGLQVVMHVCMVHACIDVPTSASQCLHAPAHACMHAH